MAFRFGWCTKKDTTTGVYLICTHMTPGLDLSWPLSQLSVERCRETS
jgi:hypothetical protein